jgi:3D (Asp-Asp-Asp) domain-containing protein
VKAPLALLGALATVFGVLALVAVVLGAGRQEGACSAAASPPSTNGSDSWIATAYGPPWGGIEGDGITATGPNLTAGQPALEVAVDPRVIALGSYIRVQPNPFQTTGAFLRWRHRRRDRRQAHRHLRLERTRQPGRLGRARRHRHPSTKPRRRQPPRRNRTHTTIGRRLKRKRQLPSSHREHRTDTRTDRAHRTRRNCERATRSAHGRQARDRRRQPDPHAAISRTRPALRHPRQALARL